jgi:hypothetical protein
MQLRFHPIPTLPRLSWCLRMAAGRGEADLWHGPWVATRPGFFAEGIWNGDYGSDAIDEAILMGSGGRAHAGRLVLASPSHTLEPLYTLRTRESLLVSNSLVFLLCRAGDAPQPASLRYQVLLAATTNGLHGYPRFLPTSSGRRIRVYNYCNLSVGPSLDVMEAPKPAAPSFARFDDYRGFLADTIGAMLRNARDARRSVAYAPIVTLSAGFDSPACAVFARENGCREAVTFVRGRGEPDGSTGDSGIPIAACLGMTPVALDRTDYLGLSGHPEAEFFGSPSGAMLSPIAERLEARVVFTGFQGAVWNRRLDRGYDRLVRTDPSGNAMGEFRLRVGWIHLPVPFIGSTSYLSINRISRSAEMRPWRRGGPYDKPIPARISESAGIDRSLFGQKKRAVAVVPTTEGGYHRWLTAGSERDFSAFCASHSGPGLSARHRALDALRRITALHARVNHGIERRLVRHWGVDVALPWLIPRDHRLSSHAPIDMAALLFQWSVEKLTPRYQ